MTPPEGDQERELNALRDRVRQLDEDIIALIAQRVQCARAIGAAKHALGLPTIDPVREAEVVRRAAERARAEGLPEELVRELIWDIIALARAVQQERGR